MNRNKATKKLGLRRLATVLAASGMLVMSSGVALMVTATPANAANKVGICHATSSDTNPYVFISVDDDSAKLKGHLQHRNDPNKTWKSAGTYELGGLHAAGDPKRDYIGSYTDDQGVFHALDGDITAASCNGDVEVAPTEAVADVDFTDPTCDNGNEASYDTTGSNVTFAVTDGSAAPGATIEITATADEGSVFADQSTTMVFTHTFADAVNLEGPPCVIVNPPGSEADTTASVDFTNPSCANGNDASYSTDGDFVTFAVTGGSASPGDSIEITATADEGHTFADQSDTKTFTHHFSNAVDLNGTDCVAVSPPEATPTVATPTLVHAGLMGTATPDLRGEQGLALLAAGMLLLVAGGTIGLRTNGQKNS